MAVDFRRRETFAYACEAYSRILVLGATRRERIRLAEQYAATGLPSNARVETGELVDILREAVTARNGWAAIRDRCAPDRPGRRASRVRKQS